MREGSKAIKPYAHDFNSNSYKWNFIEIEKRRRDFLLKRLTIQENFSTILKFPQVLKLGVILFIYIFQAYFKAAHGNTLLIKCIVNILFYDGFI